MKNDSWSLLLVGLLLIASLCTAVLAFTYSSYKRKLSQLELETYQANQDIARMQALASEVSEYSKKNPGVVPILRDIQERFRSPPAESAPAK